MCSFERYYYIIILIIITILKIILGCNDWFTGTRDITERNRRPRLIGWSMRITLDITLHHYA